MQTLVKVRQSISSGRTLTAHNLRQATKTFLKHEMRAMSRRRILQDASAGAQRRVTRVIAKTICMFPSHVATRKSTRILPTGHSNCDKGDTGGQARESQSFATAQTHTAQPASEEHSTALEEVARPTSATRNSQPTPVEPNSEARDVVDLCSSDSEAPRVNSELKCKPSSANKFASSESTLAERRDIDVARRKEELKMQIKGIELAQKKLELQAELFGLETR